MEPQKTSVECPYCKKNILEQNFLTHEAACQKNISLVVESKEEKKSNPPPPVEKKYAIEDLRENVPLHEKFICPKCTLSVPSVDLNKHYRECPYKNCFFCNEYYPLELIKEHKAQCPKKPLNYVNIPETRSVQPYVQPEADYQDYDENEPNLYQNVVRPQNQVIYPPGSLSSASHYSRVIFNDGHNTYQLETNNPNQIFTNISGTSNVPGMFGMPNVFGGFPNDSFFNFRGFTTTTHDTDIGGQFFEDILDHRNFIRTNRTSLFNDIGLFELLLGQLGNTQRGLRRERLDELNLIEYHKKPGEKDDEKCSICITEFSEGEKIRELPCKHTFHKQCVDTWLVQNSHCPLCKKDLNSRQLNQIIFKL